MSSSPLRSLLLVALLAMYAAAPAAHHALAHGKPIVHVEACTDDSHTPGQPDVPFSHDDDCLLCQLVSSGFTLLTTAATDFSADAADVVTPAVDQAAVSFAIGVHPARGPPVRRA